MEEGSCRLSFRMHLVVHLETEVAISDPSASTPAAQLPPAEPFVQPSQQVEQQQPSHPGVPVPPGTDAGNGAATLPCNRFSVAAAGDLSTIFECSKEGQLSSNKGRQHLFKQLLVPAFGGWGHTEYHSPAPHLWQLHPARRPGGAQ
ncbi:hypothetical protein MTO96_013981 [Rhipicephalus appendiculatus]